MITILVFLVALAPWLYAARCGYKAFATQKSHANDDDPSNDDVLNPWFRKLWMSAVAALVLDVLLYGMLWISGLRLDYLWFASAGFGEVYSTRLWLKLQLGFGAGLISFIVAWILSRAPFAIAPDLPKKSEVAADEDWQRRISGRSYGYNPNQYIEELQSWYLKDLAVAAARYLVCLAIAIIFGANAVSQWDDILLFLNSTAVGEVDPIFGKDITFYMFELPVYSIVVNSLWWLTIAGLFGGIGAMFYAFTRTEAIYGREESMRVCLKGLHVSARYVALTIVLWVFSTFLQRYELMYSESGVVFGAGYTDVVVRIPVYWILMVVWTLVAVALVGVSFRKNHEFRPRRLLTISGSLLIGTFLLSVVVPFIVQVAVVSPNELRLENPYLVHEIAGTRKAAGLDDVEVIEYDPVDDLTLEDVRSASGTLSNIRLADYRALGLVFNEMQEVRTYYEFPDVDVDRYRNFNGEYKEVLLAARELDQSKLQGNAQTWNNLHLVYTHGYGVVLTEVGSFTRDGWPDLAIKDINSTSSIDSLQITRPEIYYGDLTSDYVFVGSKMEEFSHPSGDENVYDHYEGTGGVPLGGGLRKLAFAWKFGHRVLTSSYLTPETRVMWDRKVSERISKIAPFLSLDGDHYKVIRPDGTICYIQDAYTVNTHYPYSQPWNDSGTNYIRNSVKITLDAYDGTVKFYVMDENCPVLAAWRKVFPSLFVPGEEMPEDLREHCRYPEDLLNIQSHVYGEYHMKDPRTFYNKEDTWQIATEKYGDAMQEVEPYATLVELPNETEEEFLLMVPFTPRQKNNMIAWMAGRSDGENLGKLIVYKLPKDRTFMGSALIEAQIDQHGEISNQLTLWKQKGSDVVRGNLLVIPVKGGLLYVEPIYLQSDQSPMPQLKKVVVSYGDNLEWGDTLDQALSAVFGEEPAGNVSLVPNFDVGTDVSPVVVSAHALMLQYQQQMKDGDYAAAGATLKQLEELLSKSVQGAAKEEASAPKSETPVEAETK